MEDRPRPPRPRAPSDPTLRTPSPSDPAIRAAGLGRPRAASNPDLANEEILRETVKKHGESITEHANVHKGVIRHSQQLTEHLQAQDEATAILFQHLGIEERLPSRLRPSNPPPQPAQEPKRKPRKKPELTTIKDDSWKAKVATYALIAATVAKVFWDVFHPGAK